MAGSDGRRLPKVRLAWPGHVGPQHPSPTSGGGAVRGPTGAWRAGRVCAVDRKEFPLSGHRSPGSARVASGRAPRMGPP